MLEVLCARQGLARVLTRAEPEALCGQEPETAAVAQTLRAAAAGLADPAARDAARRWIDVFERRSVQYASIPRDDGRAQRQIRVAQTKQRPPDDAPSRSFAGLPGAPGSGDVVVGLKTTDVGFGARYHLDLGTADELEIVAAQLRALDEDGRPRLGADGAPVTLAEGRGRNRVSMDPAVRIDALQRTEVVLFLRPQRRAFSREAVPISTVMAIATVLAAVPPVFDAAVPAGPVG